MTACDTPVTVKGDQWFIVIAAGRDVLCGHAFEEQNGGYRVHLRFEDSRRWNSFSVEGARAVAGTLRNNGEAEGNADAIGLADAIEQWAGLCEKMNDAWKAIGRPPGGFDSQVHGHA